MKLTPEQEALADKLTNLQRLTVLGVISGKSQRQAYYDAGGRAKTDEAADTSAYEIMSKPEVRDFYDSLVSSASEGAILTLERALERLTLMADTQITDILEFETVEVPVRNIVTGEEETKTETIWRMKESAELEKRAAAAIKSVTMTKQGPKIEMYDARDAITQLAKMRGWEAAQKIEHSGKVEHRMTLDDFYGDAES